MTILKRYKCIKSNDEQRFAVGEIYPLYNNGYKNYVVANNNVKWYEKEFPIIKRDYGIEFEEVKEKIFDPNKLITLTRIDETKLYININHIVAFYHNQSWEYTIVILSDGTQLDIKDSVESIANYF
ncbi:hypothetical protein [Enterococcus phage vB_Efm10_KEN22]